MHIIRRASADPSRRVRRFIGPSNLGSFGAGAVVGQTITGLKAGTTAASITGSIGASIGSAVGAGAAAGSVVPIVGTAIGAIVGLIASGVFNKRKDPEDYNFQQAMAIARTNGPQAVLDIGNKYLVLAGLFDLTPSQIKGNIPIYKKYGRKGEYRFVVDLCGVIESAALAGQITNSDTPQTVFNRIVQPWINSFGYGAMQDSNAEMITYILLGMTAEYIAGLQTRWYAVGGDYPFTSLQPFALPAAQTPAQPQITASPTPSPVASGASAPAVVSQTEIQRYLSGAVPSVGDTITYAYNGSNFFQLPQSGTFTGIAANRAWIVTIAGQAYTLSGGTLNPYTPPTASPQVKNADVAATVTTPVSATDSSGASVPAQYIPASGGGGGYYPQPTVTSPVSTQASPASTGFSTEEIVLGVATLLGAVYLMKHGRAR